MPGLITRIPGALGEVSTRLVLRLARCESGRVASVVIATRNRASYLCLTLAALERQRLLPGDWEVIVADECSQDATADVLNDYQSRGQFHLIPVVTRSSCRAAALNQAIRLARGAVIIFLADNRLAPPEFLLRHLFGQLFEPCVLVGDSRLGIHTHLLPTLDDAMLCASPTAAFQAADLDCPERWRHCVFEAGPDYRPVFDYFKSQSRVNPLPWVYFQCGNVSVRRELLDRAGEFSEGPPGWELGAWGLAEKELAYRLHLAGTPFRFDERAYTLAQLCPPGEVSPREVASNLSCFFSKHPELRRDEIEPLLLPA